MKNRTEFHSDLSMWSVKCVFLMIHTNTNSIVINLQKQTAEKVYKHSNRMLDWIGIHWLRAKMMKLVDLSTFSDNWFTPFLAADKSIIEMLFFCFFFTLPMVCILFLYNVSINSDNSKLSSIFNHEFPFNNHSNELEHFTVLSFTFP